MGSEMCIRDSYWGAILQNIRPWLFVIGTNGKDTSESQAVMRSFEASKLIMFASCVRYVRVYVYFDRGGVCSLIHNKYSE